MLKKGQLYNIGKFLLFGVIFFSLIIIPMAISDKVSSGDDIKDLNLTKDLPTHEKFNYLQVFPEQSRVHCSDGNCYLIGQVCNVSLLDKEELTIFTTDSSQTKDESNKLLDSNFYFDSGFKDEYFNETMQECVNLVNKSIECSNSIHESTRKVIDWKPITISSLLSDSATDCITFKHNIQLPTLEETGTPTGVDIIYKLDNFLYSEWLWVDTIEYEDFEDATMPYINFVSMERSTSAKRTGTYGAIMNAHDDAFYWSAGQDVTGVDFQLNFSWFNGGAGEDAGGLYINAYPGYSGSACNGTVETGGPDSIYFFSYQYAGCWEGICTLQVNDADTGQDYADNTWVEVSLQYEASNKTLSVNKYDGTQIGTIKTLNADPQCWKIGRITTYAGDKYIDDISYTVFTDTPPNTPPAFLQAPFINTSSNNVNNYTTDKIWGYTNVEDNQSDSFNISETFYLNDVYVWMDRYNRTNATLSRAALYPARTYYEKWDNITLEFFATDPGALQSARVNTTIMIEDFIIITDSIESDDEDNSTTDSSVVWFNLTTEDLDFQEDGFNITCANYINGTLNTTNKEWVNTTTNSGRICSFYTDSLPIGNYEISINATEGNVSTGMNWFLTVTSSAPSISWTTLTEIEGWQNYDYIFLNVSANSTIGISEVFLEWTGVNETFDNNDSSYWWENQTSLSDGNYTAISSANDTSSGEAKTTTLNFFIDTINPSINLTYPEDRDYQNTSTINWTHPDTNVDTCLFEFYQNGSNKSLDPGNLFAYLNFSEGDNNVTMWCNDSTGNENKTFYSWVLDNEANDFTAYDNSSIYATAVTITWTTDEYVNCTIYYDGSSETIAYAPGPFTEIISGLSELTTYTWNITCEDQAGNLNTSTNGEFTTPSAGSGSSSSGGITDVTTTTTTLFIEEEEEETPLDEMIENIEDFLEDSVDNLSESKIKNFLSKIVSGVRGLDNKFEGLLLIGSIFLFFIILFKEREDKKKKKRF